MSVLLIWIAIAVIVCFMFACFVLERTNGHNGVMRTAIVLASPLSAVILFIGAIITICAMLFLEDIEVGSQRS